MKIHCFIAQNNRHLVDIINELELTKEQIVLIESLSNGGYNLFYYM
jgi:hypothetical protein